MAERRTSRTRLGWARPIAGAMIVGLMVSHAPAASAQPSGTGSHAESSADATLQALVAEVTESERRVGELELNMGGLRENANRAYVDLGEARGKAERARGAVDEAKRTFGDTRDELLGAQGTFDEMARAAMRQGYSLPSALGGARDSAELLDRSSTLRRAADKQGAVVEGLDRARTEAANAESTLRKAREAAETAATEAERLHGEAERVFKEAERLLADERLAHAAAVIERDAARAALDAARTALDAYGRSGGSSDGRSENDVVTEAADDARSGVIDNGGATADDASTDQATDQATDDATGDEPTVTARPGESGRQTTAPTTRPSTAPTTTTAPSQDSTEDSTTDSTTDTTTDSTDSTTDSANDSTVGGTSGGDAGTSESNGGTTGTDGTSDGTGTNATTVQTATPANPESATPSAGDRAAKIETVISRAMAQVGTPYAWGGGDASGPTKGIRDGGVADAHGDYNKVGFDCSGLTLYAYAGIGITLPHYTGYQYQRGTHHPASEMQRGDLIFYGPNGHGHVAIYLGNGQMVEAPQSGSTVRVTAVRYNGMTPNVVRLV
ncbi:NlpC/P60 family protein [Corynebacterium sp. NPDC060344]|uniref:NlpC/P60 family protein n=1 Tax=Corynebacterium sp. NPDC060344 TaxID=3347101 RepID=UPI00366438D9